MKNLKAKIENFWYYHKGATIITLILIFSIFHFFTMKGEYISSDGTVALVSSAYVCDTDINFNDLIQDKIVDVNGDGAHTIHFGEFILNNESANEETIVQQILASFSSGETGVYIFDKANLDRFMSYDAFEPLDTLLPKETLDERGAYLKDGKVYAVSLAGCGLIEKYNFNTDELFAAIIFDRPFEDTDEKSIQLVNNSKILLSEILK